MPGYYVSKFYKLATFTTCHFCSFIELYSSYNWAICHFQTLNWQKQLMGMKTPRDLIMLRHTVWCHLGLSPSVTAGLQKWQMAAQITRFIGPTRGPPGADGTQVGPMLVPWTLLSGRTNWSGTRHHQIAMLSKTNVVFMISLVPAK